MGATCSLYIYLALAEGAYLCGRSGRSFCGLFLAHGHKTVYELYYHEQNESHDNKVYNSGDEVGREARYITPAVANGAEAGYELKYRVDEVVGK